MAPSFFPEANKHCADQLFICSARVWISKQERLVLSTAPQLIPERHIEA